MDESDKKVFMKHEIYYKHDGKRIISVVTFNGKTVITRHERK